MPEAQNLDAVFAALSDPTRRRILERLARGPLLVGEIASQFSISQPGISKHVRILEEAGLISRHIRGREHLCSLTPQTMASAATWIDKQRTFWTATLNRLDEHLQSQRKRRAK